MDVLLGRDQFEYEFVCCSSRVACPQGRGSRSADMLHTYPCRSSTTAKDAPSSRQETASSSPRRLLRACVTPTELALRCTRERSGLLGETPEDTEPLVPSSPRGPVPRTLGRQLRGHDDDRSARGRDQPPRHRPEEPLARGATLPVGPDDDHVRAELRGHVGELFPGRTTAHDRLDADAACSTRGLQDDLLELP